MSWWFWILALFWLPAGVIASALVRFGMAPDETMLLSLAPVAPCGLPLALGCRRLWRLGHRRAAGLAAGILGVVTVAVSLPAGLLGPLAIAACALLISLPVWIASWRLARRE